MKTLWGKIQNALRGAGKKFRGVLWCGSGTAPSASSFSAGGTPATLGLDTPKDAVGKKPPIPERPKPMTIQEQIIATAQRYGVDPNLALAVARQESGFNPAAVSPVGAIGVFQLMPATARELGVDPYNVAQNIEGGVRYLSQLLRQYGNDVNRALAAYNWGMGNLAKAISSYGEQWIFHAPEETKNYIRNIARAVGDVFPGGSSGPDSGTVALLLLGALLFFWAVS